MENMKILDNRYVKIVGIIFSVILFNLIVIMFPEFQIKTHVTLQYTVVADEIDTYQLFYSDGEAWSEEASIKQEYIEPEEKQTLTYSFPKTIKQIRIDLGNNKGEVLLSNISIKYMGKSVDLEDLVLNQNTQTSDISNISLVNDGIKVIRNDIDPYIVIDVPNEEWGKIDRQISVLFKIIICIGINAALAIFINKRRVVKGVVQEVYQNKELIWNLSKNDFKTKYAGSYLGITWAFVQPVVTVLVYWFVFQVGFRSGSVGDFPFVLWLVSGIVPWFFFSDALTNATNSMLEYSYLVKKVVFKISILPVVKIISALFVHIFFIGFTILLFSLYGYMPSLYMLQVIYYTFCMFILVLGISYATCSIVIFFKDLGQVINIFLQVGMWMTPIMWNYEMVGPQYQWILKLNPMYYIVQGYRDSFIEEIGFWHRFNQGIYFWIIAIGLFGVGTIIFKRLKVHFADVL